MRTKMCVLPAGSAWWNKQRPPAAESLWAFALKSALPYLENRLWDPVPDLPHPPARKPTALTLDDERWGELCSEVAPLPQTSPALPPSPATPASPDPPSPRESSGQDLGVQHRPAPNPPDRCPSPHGEQSAGPRGCSPPPQPFPCRREEAASTPSEGRLSVGGRQKDDTRAGSRPTCTQRWAVSGSSGPPGEEEEVQKSVAAGGGGLRSCPMCLLQFPDGFSQMDCDSHLAQCLSEMNVDMTW
ncbi:Fanconi anemia core complex-associated protein 20 isoform X2 [Cololabis saira]|uniref:Fanconi anemia core complex-associated protein 20 isoform X2 n=1 Tax=Cololabis saira TaxID=129043 RepID=UPI002AD41B2D|nr:Fanconi anemia core complex-associated protein 20 isoform X2 [Cololabis saira]